MKIRVLSLALSNQIAAGEVVERPASVVKELIENSLDAGATGIDLAVEKAGSKLVRVTDNGEGMAEDDLPLAFLRHATSKIASSDDLFHISTLGFRGEALPSIASVARVRVVSRPRGATEGAEMAIEGGTIEPPRKCGAPEGTTIEVRDLFYNVPARRKFLKSDATEMSHITEAVTRAALAHASVHFTLSHNGRSVLNVPEAADRRDRVAAFFGGELAAQLVRVASRHPVLEIDGLVGPPSLSRPNARMQYCFLNGRYVRDAVLNHAVGEAYRSLLGQRQYPVALLWLAVDPEQVDVNVHPMKIEVRFRNPQLIHELVYHAVREGLRQARALPVPVAAPPAPPSPRETGALQQSIREAITDFFAQPSGRTAPVFRPPERTLWERTQPPGTDQPPRPAGGDAAGEAEAAEADAPADAAVAPPAPAPPEPLDAVLPSLAPAAAEPSQAPASLSGGRFLQVMDTYIVEETGEGLRITDQHALHERILYERIKRQLEGAPIASQRLLIPALIEFSAREFVEVMSLQEEFRKLGIEFDAFGERTVAVRAVPQVFRNLKLADFFRELLAELPVQSAKESAAGRLDLLARVMACKAAVKAGQRLSALQVRELLMLRDRQPGLATCPHGRPVSLLWSADELERRFKRK